MNTEADCFACRKARALIALVPIARAFGVEVYECPYCHGTLQLVTQVTKADVLNQQCEESTSGQNAARSSSLDDDNSSAASSST